MNVVTILWTQLKNAIVVIGKLANIVKYNLDGVVEEYLPTLVTGYMEFVEMDFCNLHKHVMMETLQMVTVALRHAQFKVVMHV